MRMMSAMSLSHFSGIRISARGHQSEPRQSPNRTRQTISSDRLRLPKSHQTIPLEDWIPKEMATRKFVTWNVIQTEHGNGSWAIIDGWLTVRTALGTMSTDPGNMPPEFLAGILMREQWEAEGHHRTVH